MEEYYAYFLEEMGPALGRREVPLSTLDKYAEKLPQQLLKQWRDHGWSGYAEGLFWTVNPAEYQELITAWLDDSGIPDSGFYHTIARSAFGDLYLWHEKAGNWLNLTIPYARFHRTKPNVGKYDFDKVIEVFFVTQSREANDLDDLFEKALRTLGPLQVDEMYGFVPALALGGPADLTHLQKVKTIEHLTFLSQLAPLTDWGFPDFDNL
uniref:DUF1851 domain-containing protein n=1 Tax=Pseudomonas graminis TaxID=158627 RepID=A0A7C2AYU3_9PSED